MKRSHPNTFDRGYLKDGTPICFLHRLPRGRWLVASRRRKYEIKPEWWLTRKP